MNDAKPLAGSRALRPVLILALPAFLLVAGAWAGPVQGQDQEDARPAAQPSQASQLKGKTQPSKTMDLAFANLGRIGEVNVKEGDRVEQGQVLARQDARADEARLRGLEARADVAARVELARTQAELAQVELEVVRNAKDALAKLEERRAELEVKAAETRILEEERQGTVAQHEAEEQRIIIEQKTLTSPDAGIIQAVDTAVGEVFGPQTPAMRLVKTDPLHVEVIEAPASEVRRLKVGDVIQVRYMGEDEWREATVTFINPVGIPVGGSSRLPFKAELPNPDGRSAGLDVEVRLPAGGRTAAAGAAGGNGGQ